ncbi:YebC/PmpR family DNA-binding transcriptional regulator [Candidatus Contubernalis alkaliaceticus]|uniref:YebC/PmpR family DNA-binding transcriptional regulator n=1 Tax=Candidatus Contubernalis alkaliaceticus TaxID=338645 RepID=UPI001F4C33FA|nr:YebC/PmpR family DNA-binding transcriptional regulator [Candidatus Contubernalis alkalaceticus]UNC92628.1 YebC/PmpR family DNA-binding transcriptional regulator [Candidatus Contubernalis alkalaceticus]
MAGHSKWANIKHRKARVDEQKGKIFTKLSKELMVAAREGGGDIDTNFRLRLAVQKAREENIPNDNINRAIKKALGDNEGIKLEEITYEGYGPSGVAVMLDIVTDNRNRTAGEIRNILSRNGGNLGETGCVAWMFSRQGYISIEKGQISMDEDEIMLLALEAGAEDFRVEEDIYEVITVPENMEKVKEILTGEGIEMKISELTMVPQSVVEINDQDEAAQIISLMETLEDHDDVQNVYANFEIPEELMNSL